MPLARKTTPPSVLAARRALAASRRLVGWATRPAAFPRPELADPSALPFTLYRQRIRIARDDPDAEPRFEAGKRANVALAAPSLHGVRITPDRPFSLWRALGRPTRDRGFRAGMALDSGCIVPAVGGGLCLLSNGLFELAARLGFDILERHGHSQEAVPDHRDPWGLDATLAWPHVDLRFAPRAGPVVLEARVDGDHLVLGAHAAHPLGVWTELRGVDDHTDGEWRTNRIVREIWDVRSGGLVEARVIATNRKRLLDTDARRRSCLTCGEVACPSRVRFLEAA